MAYTYRKMLLTAVGMSLIIAAAAGGGSRADSTPEIVWHKTPRVAPATVFQDGAGADKHLKDFAGKVLVVNFWATWCGPCVNEMPTLDTLQMDLGGAKFQVVAINQDREGKAAAEPFIAKHGWKYIALLTEAPGHFQKDAKMNGLPTSIIIDKHGKEVARIEGDTVWNAPQLEEKLRTLMDAP